MYELKIWSLRAYRANQVWWIVSRAKLYQMMGCRIMMFTMPLDMLRDDMDKAMARRGVNGWVGYGASSYESRHWVDFTR